MLLLLHIRVSKSEREYQLLTQGLVSNMKVQLLCESAKLMEPLFLYLPKSSPIVPRECYEKQLLSWEHNIYSFLQTPLLIKCCQLHFARHCNWCSVHYSTISMFTLSNFITMKTRFLEAVLVNSYMWIKKK